MGIGVVKELSQSSLVLISNWDSKSMIAVVRYVVGAAALLVLGRFEDLHY
jgi:hypothetical protein